MATVYARKGSKLLWLRYTDASGKDVRRSSGTEDPNAAQELLDRLLAGEAAMKLTITNAMDQFFRRVEVRPSTWRCYATAARNWVDFLTVRYLEDIKPATIEQFITHRRTTANARRSHAGVAGDPAIRADLAFLSALFSFHQLPNPIPRGFKRKRLKRPVERVRYLTAAEAERLLAEAPVHLRGIIRLALETGMRKSELLYLRWEQVHLEWREIHLDVGDTKTHQRRVVPLSDAAVRLLAGTVPHHLSPFVFHDGTGKPFVDIKKGWAAACRRAGIVDFRFHDLRHTFASWYRQRGGLQDRLKEILGHRSLQMTERYSHLRAVDLHDDLRRVGTFLGADPLIPEP